MIDVSFLFTECELTCCSIAERAVPMNRRVFLHSVIKSHSLWQVLQVRHSDCLRGCDRLVTRLVVWNPVLGGVLL